MERRKLPTRGRVVVSVPPEVDVAALRERLGMTQSLFAARFGFPLETLKHWEYGRRKPSGASLTLLNVIARSPRAVLATLRTPGRDLRPVEDYTALWDAEQARNQSMRLAGEDETSKLPGCPRCGRPWPSIDETQNTRFRKGCPLDTK